MAFAKVAEILAAYKDIDVSLITPTSTFSELGLDSLDMVELVMALEDEFSISIEMNENLKTVGNIAALIDESK